MLDKIAYLTVVYDAASIFAKSEIVIYLNLS